PGIDESLQTRTRVDASLQNSAAIEVEKSVRGHLRAPVQAELERRRSAFGFDEAAMPAEERRGLENLAIRRRLFVPALACVEDRIAQLADTELQCAAVSDERAHVEGDRMLDARYWRVGRRVEGRRCALDQVIVRISGSWSNAGHDA